MRTHNILINRSCIWTAVFLIFILISSQKAEDYGYLKVKLKWPGMEDWKATKMIPDKYVSEILQIAGTNGNSELWIQVQDPQVNKTRQLEQTDLNHFRDEQSNMYMISRGSIMVTAMDEQWIAGYFEFNAADNRSGKKINALNGYFKVPNPKRFKN